MQLPVGIKSAAKIFPEMEEIVVIADDLVVFGRSQKEHDKRLYELLQRCHTVGVKLNPDKFEMCLDDITFMGHCITKEGIKVDPEN